MQRMGEGLELLSAHDALTLLRNTFALPKLLCLLCTAPCFSSSSLVMFDECLCCILSRVTNSHLALDDYACTRASLPVSLGGLGLCSAVIVAPSVFLASSHASAELIDFCYLRIHIHAPMLMMHWRFGHNIDILDYVNGIGNGQNMLNHAVYSCASRLCWSD